MKISNTIPSSFSVANFSSEKSADKSANKCFYVPPCVSVSTYFHLIPWDFSEDQIARSLSLDAFNHLQNCLCMRFDGGHGDETPDTAGMSDSEKATVMYLFNRVAPKIDAIVERKKAKADKCREAGRKGGRPKKGGVSIDCEEKKGSPFSDVVSCSKQEENDAISNLPGEKNHYKEIRGRKVHRNSSSTGEKGYKGEKGLDPLPPFIPPKELLDLSGETDSDSVFEIRCQLAEKRPDLTPRRHWQKYRPRFVTEMGVTWEVRRNVTPVEALMAIPCPVDFNIWFPIVISAKRAGVPNSVLHEWSRKGCSDNDYDFDLNEYFFNYAARPRQGGITEKLLFKVYNYGLDCVGRYSKAINAEMAHLMASDGKTSDTHADTGEAGKNAVVKPVERNLAIEEPLPEPEFVIAKPQAEANVEPPKPEVELVPQTTPANGEPTEDEKRQVLEDYMIGERGLDLETISYFGDEAKWDAYRKSWYIAIKEDGYETKRYLDVPPDSKVKGRPRYMVSKNAGLKNHRSEHLFEKDNEVVFLVEGQFDARALYSAGHYLAVGVKNLDQLEADLKNPRLTAMHFVIVSDRDETGLSNAKKWSDVLTENGVTPHVCRLPKGCRDVADMLKAQGREAVRRLVEDFMVEEGITAPVSAESADCPF